MKTALAIALVLAGVLTFAAAQDEPMQVWLVALAPFALVVIALLLHISDGSKYN